MRHKNTFLVFLLLLVPMIMTAQNRRGRIDNYHFGYVSVAGGYSSLDENVKSVTTQGSGAFALGLGYEFRRHNFWLNVGAQLQAMQSKSVLDHVLIEAEPISVTATGERYNGLTSDGAQCLFRYEIDQEDVQTLHSVDIPLMLGYYYHGFYVGAGAKVGFSTWSFSKSNTDYAITGYLTTMDPNHEPLSNIYPDFINSSCSVKRDVRLNVRGALIGEVGYDVLATLPSHGTICHVLKIGFYFEYGLNNIISADNQASHLDFAVDNSGNRIANQPQVNPIYSTAISDFKGSSLRVAPYMVGLKISYLIGGSRTGGTGTWHRGCQCYDN